MRKNKIGAIVIKCFVLLVVLGTAYQAMAQDAMTPYPKMAPIKQYLMDRTAEIDLARSDAPESISRDAEVRVLGRHGFEMVVKGKNGFVCIVERSWTSATDPDFWNPKVRTPICYNAAAVHSVLPRNIKRTALILAGRTPDQTDEAIATAVIKKTTAGDGTRSDVLPDVEARIWRRQRRTLASSPHVLFFADRPRVLGSGSAGFPHLSF